MVVSRVGSGYKHAKQNETARRTTHKQRPLTLEYLLRCPALIQYHRDIDTQSQFTDRYKKDGAQLPDNTRSRLKLICLH